MCLFSLSDLYWFIQNIPLVFMNIEWIIVYKVQKLKFMLSKILMKLNIFSFILNYSSHDALNEYIFIGFPFIQSCICLACIAKQVFDRKRVNYRTERVLETILSVIQHNWMLWLSWVTYGETKWIVVRLDDEEKMYSFVLNSYCICHNFAIILEFMNCSW